MSPTVDHLTRLHAALDAMGCAVSLLSFDPGPEVAGCVAWRREDGSFGCHYFRIHEDDVAFYHGFYDLSAEEAIYRFGVRTRPSFKRY